MAETGQSYSNHVRYHAPFHFVGFPLVTISLVWVIYRMVQHPGIEEMIGLIVVLALIITFFLTRLTGLKVQDRLIRLEEQLRFQRVLAPELAARAMTIPIPFLVALRFSSDHELPGLVEKVLEGKFEKPADVKKAIVEWRGDYWRV